MAPIDPPDGPTSGLSHPTSEPASEPTGEPAGAALPAGAAQVDAPDHAPPAPITTAIPDQQSAGDVDPVMQVAADLQAGRVSVDQAVDRLIASAIADLGGGGAWREQLGDVLGSLAETDPAIARLEARLARASTREDDS